MPLKVMSWVQDDSTEQDGMSKAEVLKVLQAHMDDIKVNPLCQTRLFKSPGPKYPR